MACQLGKGIYGRSVFSKARLFWEKDVVLFQEPHQSAHEENLLCSTQAAEKSQKQLPWGVEIFSFPFVVNVGGGHEQVAFWLHEIISLMHTST